MSVRLEQLLAAATPGPWDNPEWGGLVVDEDENPVAYHVMRKNAALIAKTPDMARLLIDMGEWIAGHGGMDEGRELLARLDALGEDTA